MSIAEMAVNYLMALDWQTWAAIAIVASVFAIDEYLL